MEIYIKLKAGLNKGRPEVVQFKPLKAIKGDKIDELFVFHLNKHQLNLKVTRIKEGKYMFGTR